MTTRRFDRRALLRRAACVGVVLALPGCRRQGGTATPGAAATPTATAEAPVVVSAVAGYDKPNVWQGRRLVVSSWGGDYEDAQRRAIFEPFQALTGARVDTERTDTGQLRTQVEDGQTVWDISDVLAEDVLPLANVGVLEELDFNIIEVEDVFDDLKTEYSVASSYYSTVLAYLNDAWPGSAGPASWADFWDAQRFPGLRGLRRDPQTTLEFALLAAGVDPNQLYPLDADRAFASLERIRPNVSLWWEQGAQPTQTLTGGAAAMVSAWHSRILKVQSEGAAVTMVWNGGALSGDAWVVPKGAKNRDIAMDFINFATRPEVSAAFASLAPFGPVNKKAFDYLSVTARANLPTSPELRDKQFVIDLEWWFKHRDAMTERFEDWLAEHP